MISSNVYMYKRLYVSIGLIVYLFVHAAASVFHIFIPLNDLRSPYLITQSKGMRRPNILDLSIRCSASTKFGSFHNCGNLDNAIAK